MMNGQPQVDIDIINELIIDAGKKTDSPFLLNRLDKAVSALERTNPEEGYFARTLYLGYINKPKEAIEFITEKMNRFGNRDIWEQAKISIARTCGDWNTYKKTVEEYFFNISSDVIRQDIITAYIQDSIMYRDFSGNFETILKSSNLSSLQLEIDKIYTSNEIFDEYGVSLETYRRVLDISNSCIDKRYNITTKVRLRLLDCIQVIHSSSLWSNEEAIELTQEINDAIMKVNDVDFQLEADDIEVFCINFSPDKLPEDFSLYDDDNEDQELAKLIESRMQSNPKLEAFDA